MWVVYYHFVKRNSLNCYFYMHQKLVYGHFWAHLGWLVVAKISPRKYLVLTLTWYLTLVQQPFSTVSQYQNGSILDFIGGKDNESDGDNWSCKPCKAPVKSSPPTNQHTAFHRPGALPVAQSTVSEYWRGEVPHSTDLLTPLPPGCLPALPLTTKGSWLPLWGLPSLSVSRVCTITVNVEK